MVQLREGRVKLTSQWGKQWRRTALEMLGGSGQHVRCCAADADVPKRRRRRISAQSSRASAGEFVGMKGRLAGGLEYEVRCAVARPARASG